MATVVRMPEVLAGVTEAAILAWLVEPGQTIAVGTPLVEVETEKAVVEVAAEVDGTVLRIAAAAGATVPIGDPIVVIGAPGEAEADAAEAGAIEAGAGPATEGSASGAVASGRGEPTVVAAPIAPGPAPDAAQHHGSVGQIAAGHGARRVASPIVRRLARERGIDLGVVVGTGPGGRIVRRDLDALGASAPASVGAPAAPSLAAPSVAVPSAAPGASPAWEEIPLTGMRRAIARRLSESKATVPHFYLTADCRVDRLLALRAEINAAQGVRVSVNDFVLKAVAAALREVPEANATWGDTVIRRHAAVDIAVAVAIDGGLVTPVVRDVDRLPLSGVSAAVADLAGRARAGRLKQHELDGGAVAVSNLGMYGTTEFAAIINPPHAGILAVGAARALPVVDDGALAVGQVLTVTLSADHRVLDGAIAAQWLAAFQRRIEQPLTMLV